MQGEHAVMFSQSVVSQKSHVSFPVEVLDLALAQLEYGDLTIEYFFVGAHAEESRGNHETCDEPEQDLSWRVPCEEHVRNGSGDCELLGSEGLSVQVAGAVRSSTSTHTQSVHCIDQSLQIPVVSPLTQTTKPFSEGMEYGCWLHDHTHARKQ